MWQFARESRLHRLIIPWRPILGASPTVTRTTKSQNTAHIHEKADCSTRRPLRLTASEAHCVTPITRETFIPADDVA
jgi:hypothetical protein